MPDDILTPPAPARETESRPRRIVCEFCESELGPSGEYKHLSDRAKKLRKAEERIDELQAEIVRLNAEISSLNTARVNEIPAPVILTRGGIAI